VKIVTHQGFRNTILMGYASLTHPTFLIYGGNWKFFLVLNL